ncbi:MAG: hypothetical protein IH946_09685, partial [Bacteroidetes bacterium]|nr:hypothetical protein [Bacteroidota bacterium]
MEDRIKDLGSCVVELHLRRPQEIEHDTSNQFSCSSIITLQVNDTTIPTIKTANNVSRFLKGLSINFTYNVTDNFDLSFGQVIVTENSITRIFNISITGTSAEFSQNITIFTSAGGRINVTGIVNDTFNNKARVGTIFDITKDFFVNATNLYDNTSILSFSVTIANSTFNENKSTETGLLNFSDLVNGNFEINISSNVGGGYHNISIPIHNITDNFQARMFQAIVYFTANIRGTAFNVTDYSISLPLA